MRGSVITRTDETVGQSYRDLREWLELVDQMGELRVINGADWNLEIAAITELARMESKEQPALLFDQIKDHPAGYRVLSGMNNTIRRLAREGRLPAVRFGLRRLLFRPEDVEQALRDDTPEQQARPGAAGREG